MKFTKNDRSSLSTRTRLMLLGALVPFVTPLSAQAGTQYWKVASGMWNTSTYWSSAADFSTPGATPAGGDTANIWNNDEGNRVVSLNMNVPTALAALNISNIGSGTNTFWQGTFNFASVNISVGGRGNGNGAHGAYMQSGGTTTATGFLAVGDVVGSTGTYTMTGGALNLSNSGLYVGNNGTGTFTQSGTSSVTTTGTTPVYLGFNANTSGTYNHNGGTLAIGGTIQVGRNGAGVFNQTAGTTTIKGALQVASTAAGSSGSVTVGPNASLSVAGNTVLGGSVPSSTGPGSLTVQGNVTLNSLMIHQSGTLNLVSGGNLTVGNFTRRLPTSVFNWTGGTLNMPAVSITHATNSGNFGAFYGEHLMDQNVTLNVANALDVGLVSGSSGQMTQTAGTVTVGTSSSPGALNVGIASGAAGGTYVLANTGVMTVNGNVNLNQGVMSVNGGTMSVTRNFRSTGANGTLNLGGGSLSIGESYGIVGPTNQSGGALAVTGTTMVEGAAFTQSGGTATFAGPVNAYSVGRINVSGTAQLTANGKVTLGNSTTGGSLSVAGGAVTVNNNLESVHGSANIILSGGSLTANNLTANGPVTQTGGTLNTGTFRISDAPYVLSGGTATINNEVDIYSSLNVSGTAALQVNGGIYFGGNSMGIGGVGSLIMTGGTVAATSGLAAFNGNMKLSGGSLNVGSLQIGSLASYEQSNGTVNTSAIYAGNAQSFVFSGGTINLVNGSATLVSSGFLIGDGINAATLNLENSALNNGVVAVAVASTLSGTGSVNSTFTSSGLVSPGTTGDVGTLTFAGSSTFNASSRTLMHLTTGTTGDRIIANAITLGGTLELSSNAGFAPAAYASQRLISATSVSGRFGQLAGNLQESGHALAVTYDSTGVLVTAAIAGDTNLDRAVNFDDLLTLAQNYGLTTGQTWSTGDLNGSGSVDFDDLLGLAQTYGTSAIMTSALPAEFAADWALARSLTPEPTALFTLATAAAMPRRRRIA